MEINCYRKSCPYFYHKIATYFDKFVERNNENLLNPKIFQFVLTEKEKHEKKLSQSSKSGSRI